MARTQRIVESITCDVCGRPAREDLTTTLAWNDDQWSVDLCPADYRKVAKQFDRWIANSDTVALKKSPRRTRSPKASSTNGDWSYLESLGFTKHRGRKSAVELEALANRKR